jgi:hypothetical protein
MRRHRTAKRKAQSPFRPVVGWLNALLEQKDPKVTQLGLQMSSKPARFIFSGSSG